MSQQTERVCVAVEIDQVAPFFVGNHRFDRQSVAFRKISGYGALSGVPEWGIAHIVGKACGTYNLYDMRQLFSRRSAFIARHQHTAYFVGERFPDTRHLQAVRQPVVDEDAARQGEYLRLVLQSAEWRRKHKAVEIALEVASGLRSVAAVAFHTQPLAANQSAPFHPVFIICNLHRKICLKPYKDTANRGQNNQTCLKLLCRDAAYLVQRQNRLKKILFDGEMLVCVYFIRLLHWLMKISVYNFAPLSFRCVWSL